MRGTWRYLDDHYPVGLVYESVTFHKNGTYALAYAVDTGKTKRLSGTYRIGRRGKITFRAKGRVAPDRHPRRRLREPPTSPGRPPSASG